MKQNVVEKRRPEQVVRLIDRDVDANFPVYFGLTRITGISWSFANAILKVLGIDRNKKLSELSEEELEKIEDVARNPEKYNIPAWLFNNQKDYYSGENKHYISSDVKLKVEFNIRRLKKIRAYRGIRHELNLPVRGQSTKTHFKQMKKRGKKGVVVYKKQK